jgi:hypothetical protein
MDVLERLRAEDQTGAARAPIEPLPGWFARRRRDCRPGNEVVAGLPAGPAPRQGRRR